jgi:hypothetical protein
MLFKKNNSANLISKSTNYWKSRPRKRKKHKILYLTWKVGFLYYFTVSNKFTYGQFKTYLKLLKIHFKQIAKTIPTVGENLVVIFFYIHFVLYSGYRFLNLYYIYYFFWYDVMFSLCCTVFWPSVLCFRNL